MSPHWTTFFCVLYGIGTPNNLAANFFSCGDFFQLAIIWINDALVVVVVKRQLGVPSNEDISASRQAR